MNVLKKLASVDTRPLQVRVSKDLLERIKAVQAKAKQKKLRFDVVDVVEAALWKAVKVAEEELKL